MIFKKQKIETLSDIELMARYRKTKNEKFFGHIFKRYAHLVYGVCLKYLKNTADAEDAMMQIFEKSLTDFKKNEITYPKSWLYSVTKNFCLMQLRKKTIAIDSLAIVDDLNAQQDLANKQIEKEMLLNQLEKGLEELKEDQKIGLKLFYLENKSYQQIADQTGWELKKVKSEIQNGKRNLKLKVKEQN